jgi:hypothetical protein
MKPQYEKNLEAQIDRALKGLPDLMAPSGLLPRVLQTIARRHSLPWYRQPWQMWPPALRLVTMVFLLASCGALCAACWQLTRAAGFSVASQEVAQTFSGVTAIWNALNVLLSALVLVVKHFGTLFMIGCGLALALGYAICVGLGTACVRLAYARR